MKGLVMLFCLACFPAVAEAIEGTWQGRIYLNLNTCSSQFSDSQSVKMRIRRMGVVYRYVRVSDGVTVSGRLSRRRAALTGTKTGTYGGLFCVDWFTYRLSNITSNRAYLTYTAYEECQDGTGCSIGYIGQIRKR